jgi:hypothetical protein
MATTLSEMHDLFRPIVRTLDASEYQPEEARLPDLPACTLGGGL